MLHEVGLRHVDYPLHVLGGIETGLQQPCARLYWLMLPSAPTPNLLALELGEIGERVDALVVERLA